MKELILRKDFGNQAITVKSSPTQQDVYLFTSNFETPEQCVKYVQSNSKDTRTTLMSGFCCLYC